MTPELFGPPRVDSGHAPAHRPRYWLHAALLAATLMTTTIVGARMQQDFRNNLPFMGLEGVWQSFMVSLNAPASLLDGLPFSLTLLTILLAHEFGHYLACLHYRLDASLPYFLPAPVLTGTFGAFIRIRTPIYSRRTLFDVAAAGPVAGFLLLVPALLIGLAWSKVIPGIVDESELRFGTPGLLWLFEKLVLPGVAHADIYLHPIGRAAYIGMLATAWNLIPVGQLDGGHVLYSLAGEWHKTVSIIAVAVLALLGFAWWGWWLWAVVLWFSRRHPFIYDEEPLGAPRRRLGWVTFWLFAACFVAVPFDLRPGA